MPHGWKGLMIGDDPFDPTSYKIIEISKNGFVVDCDLIVFRTHLYQVDGSRDPEAQIQFKIDDNPRIVGTGKWGYMRLFTPYSWFIFETNNRLIREMMRGNRLKAAGNGNEFGWVVEELDLAGFTNVYREMCD